MASFKQGHWNLTELVTDPKGVAFRKQLEEIEAKVRNFEKMKNVYLHPIDAVTKLGHHEAVKASGVAAVAGASEMAHLPEAIPLPETGVGFSLEQIVAEHHLGQNSYDSLEQLTRDYPSLRNNPEAIEKIIAASRIGPHAEYTDHADFLKPGVNNLIKSGGVRRLDTFEAIRYNNAEGID